ncbi:hypothetical protein [Granulicella arctica]|uniref:hypothetical protein n=1 Tax=Granulicella arctica TaxID=940613 RepID=UPI0021E0D46A|nr:hypothetical protein [Granulicella arctica]
MLAIALSLLLPVTNALAQAHAMDEGASLDYHDAFRYTAAWAASAHAYPRQHYAGANDGKTSHAFLHDRVAVESRQDAQDSRRLLEGASKACEVGL